MIFLRESHYYYKNVRIVFISTKDPNILYLAIFRPIYYGTIDDAIVEELLNAIPPLGV
jgi:hypothetical protein